MYPDSFLLPCEIKVRFKDAIWCGRLEPPTATHSQRQGGTNLVFWTPLSSDECVGGTIAWPWVRRDEMILENIATMPDFPVSSESLLLLCRVCSISSFTSKGHLDLWTIFSCAAALVTVYLHSLSSLRCEFQSTHCALFTFSTHCTHCQASHSLSKQNAVPEEQENHEQSINLILACSSTQSFNAIDCRARAIINRRNHAPLLHMISTTAIIAHWVFEAAEHWPFI